MTRGCGPEFKTRYWCLRSKKLVPKTVVLQWTWQGGQPSGAQEEWSPDIGLCLFEILGRPREDFFVSHVTSSGDQCGTG